MQAQENQKTKFLKSEWVDAVSKKGNPYTAFRVVFEVDGKEFKHMLFPPRSDAEKRYLNEILRNLCETLGVDYDSIPAAEPGDNAYHDFTSGITKALSKYEGDGMYIKTVRGKSGYVELGQTLPVFSSDPNLEYSEGEIEMTDVREGVEVAPNPF
jgi:hypothetical protein